ncbi:sensor histidine kinase [Sphaerimonospora cavernae]|uniref:Sensor histidine kinase n=1 Tax=Sphaerimonospora cavernae TaxID=1740611 RepID=A0ABV6U7C6_9ACTN
MSSPIALITLVLIGVPLFVLPMVLVRRLRRLSALQAEAVRQAAAEARQRLARDVHDLLSSRLWLASLKSELAYRRADEDSPTRAALAEVIESIRQAATDIRNVTRSYQEISLWSELTNARAVLTAYGTGCEVEASEVELAPELNAMLAVTVREAVTNVLRHSRASLCVIKMTLVEMRGAGEVKGTNSRVCLSVANDGAGPLTAPGAGSGIHNLRSRAAELGGTVTTVIDPDGWFQLIAEIPTPSPR